MEYTFNNDGFNTIVNGKDLDEIAVNYCDFMLLFQKDDAVTSFYFPFDVSSKAAKKIHELCRRYYIDKKGKQEKKSI